MKRRFQIAISLSVFLLLAISTITFTLITRGIMYRVLVEQVVEDNKVIGKQILDILNLLDYEDVSEDKLVDYLQRFCNEVMLPNEGFVCVANSEGRLVALPGLENGEEMFIDNAEFFTLDESRKKEFKDIEEGELVKGFFVNPESGSNDIIVSMPIGTTGLRVLVHQSRAGVRERASEIIKPFLFMQIGFSIIVSFFVFLVVNAQVKRHESTLEKLNAELVVANKELDRVNNQRMQLLHMLSHDLANPIGAIKSVCEICYEEQGSNAVNEYHEMVLSSVKRSMGIIDLVRKLEALETGKMQLDLSPVNIKRSLESSMQDLRSKYASKKIEFRLDVPFELYGIAEFYSLTNTVFSNILSNAAKFSPPSACVEISAFDEETDVSISITDHGIGIPEELRGTLFDVGARTNRPGTEGEEGTGFGMPQVKSFIEHFGGTIEIMSKTTDEDPKNHGTSVVIRLRKAPKFSKPAEITGD